MILAFCMNFFDLFAFKGLYCGATVGAGCTTCFLIDCGVFGLLCSVILISLSSIVCKGCRIFIHRGDFFIIGAIGRGRQ